MQTNIQLKTLKLPKLLSDLNHSNQFLKMFSISLLGITLVMLILIFAMAMRAPTVLSLEPSGQSLIQVKTPKPEDEIKVAVRRYLELRYKWTPETVKSQLQEAQAFVNSNSVKAYQGAIANVVKFSVEKQVSQRIYVNETDVNLDKKIALITGDRISAVQGLKAAGDLKIEISFDSGPRTKENPWGVYVVKEKEL